MTCRFSFYKNLWDTEKWKDVILLRVTEKSLDMAIELVKPGARIGDIGATIQEYVESFGFSVPRDYTGHGIGAEMHEDPMFQTMDHMDLGWDFVLEWLFVLNQWFKKVVI